MGFFSNVPLMMRFGSIPRNRFSWVCDMAPCAIEYTLQSTGRSGYFAVPLVNACICAIRTVGLNTGLRTNSTASTIHTLQSGFAPPTISENVSLLRTSCIRTLTPKRMNRSCMKRSTCNRPIISTTRLPTMCRRRSTRPALPPFFCVASMCPAVSLDHGW